VTAARELLTSCDPGEVSIQEITDTADVGFGSFYNHFQTKHELFDTTIDEIIEEHGAMLDKMTAGIEDPAEVFAASVRITARFPKTHPRMAQVIVRTGLRCLISSGGLAPRALRDLRRAKDAGRLSLGDGGGGHRLRRGRSARDPALGPRPSRAVVHRPRGGRAGREPAPHVRPAGGRGD
jgi:AcrR family transcriptional regulator